MNPESLTHLAKKEDKTKKSDKSQEELRQSLEERLSSLKTTVQEGMKEYEKSLADNAFEDQEEEPEGSGEKRKEESQKKLNALLDRAEKMKAQLDSPEPLAPYASAIQADYAHLNPGTKKKERQETITLDLEQKLQEFLAFYQKTKVDLPPDFEDIIGDIWERNQEAIQQAMEEEGFDELLVMPGDLSLPDLHAKMTEGYNATWQGDNFKEGGSFSGAQSQNTGQPRLVLVHKVQNLKDRPELAQTLNIKGQDLKPEQTPTLEDYLVFQRKYFEETRKHLDEIGATWLATKSGARLVNARWIPADARLYVAADGGGSQSCALGARSSRSFF